MSGDASKPMTGSTALVADLIQSLDANGFTLGSAQVNQHGQLQLDGLPCKPACLDRHLHR